MTYDWEGTRTRRIRNIKLALSLAVPLVVLCLSVATIALD
jgi:hypothetical protein